MRDWYYEQMRELDARLIADTVKDLIIAAVYELPDDVVEAIRAARAVESQPLARHILDDILENAAVASSQRIPLCQDTGSQIIVAELGQALRITGGSLKEAISQGVRAATTEGYLRSSIVADPLFGRFNTTDNCPPFIHLDVVPGDRLSIRVLPKGGGCENMSAMRMLKPAQGLRGVKDFVLEVICANAVNSCPPLIVGVGVGATFDSVGWLAKKSLLRSLNVDNLDSRLGAFEKDLLEEINRTGIGAMGWGGDITALAVRVESAPTHIASLPVAVNLQCHSARTKEAIL